MSTAIKEVKVSKELYEAIQLMSDVEASRMDRVTDCSMETWDYDQEVELSGLQDEYAKATELVADSGYEVYYRVEILVANKDGEDVRVIAQD